MTIGMWRLDARQHRHLGARSDLEDAERVGTADHVVDPYVLRRQCGQHIGLAIVVARIRIMIREQGEGALQAGQHAERQNIHLEDFHRVEIVLVPLDHLALVHRRLDDGHDLIEPVPGDDEAADMLGEMAGKPHDVVGTIDHMPCHRVRPAQTSCFGFPLADLGSGPAPDRS